MGYLRLSEFRCFLVKRWKMARARGLEPLTLRSEVRFPCSNCNGLQSIP